MPKSKINNEDMHSATITHSSAHYLKAIRHLLSDHGYARAVDVAAVLGISRSAVAGHIMNLTNKGIIKGRGYVISDNPFVVAIGGANMDIHGDPSGALRQHDSNPGTVRTSPGGVARNVAENLARLGTDCRLITAIGNDHHGRMLLQQGRDAGIDMQHVLQFESSQTSTYMSVLDRSGDMFVAINDMAIIDELTPERLRSYEANLKQAALLVFRQNLPDKPLSNFGLGSESYL